MDSPHKGHVMHSFDVFFVVSLNKLLNKQSDYQWFEMPWGPYDIALMTTSISMVPVSFEILYFYNELVVSYPIFQRFF